MLGEHPTYKHYLAHLLGSQVVRVSETKVIESMDFLGICTLQESIAFSSETSYMKIKKKTVWQSNG